MPTPKLIALDWGSTTARAYLMSEESDIIGQRQAPLGVLNVKNGDFEGALIELCGPWLMVRTETPIIASGMIGSRQGWTEAPYVECPAGLQELGGSMKTIDVAKRRKLWIVPGVSITGADGVPDVMRGEETQIFGALSPIAQDGGSALYLLPGTHSKWVRVENGRIVWFKTFMTGELFSVLVNHSILGRLVPSGDTHDEDAFRRGVEHAFQDPFGLSSMLFSARTLALFGKLPAPGIADYLSGLLIGHEIFTAEHALGAQTRRDDGAILVGESSLVRNYQRALTYVGWSSSAAPGFPAASGLWRVAEKAGLLGLRQEAMAPA
ncbi:MAG: 2-dehydro-3-deoxygalactonokinase [Betaproteobacteria bacterium]